MSENKYFYSAEEGNKKLKNAKIVLSILLAVVIIVGGIYTVLYANGVTNENTIDTEKAPKKSFFANVLITVEDDIEDDIDPIFLLIGFDGEQKCVTATEIPCDMTIIAPEKTASAKDLYNYGSARYLKDAVANHFGITVDKFIGCSLSEVEVFVDKLGGVDYEIDEQMQYKNSEGNLVTNLVKGRQKLNGNQYCQYLRYDAWGSDFVKVQRRVDLFTALINEHISTLDNEKILSIYKSVANHLETDISIVEMNDFSMQFAVFTNQENPVVSADVDFTDSEIAKVMIEKYYK